MLLFGAVFIYLLLRNPLTIYRRLARTVVLLAAGSLAIGASGAAKGNVNLPGFSETDYYLEWGSSPYWWGFMVLAALCLVGDLVVTAREARMRPAEFRSKVMRIPVKAAAGGGFVIRHQFAICGPPGGMTLTGATLRLEGLLSPIVPTDLYDSLMRTVQSRVTEANTRRIDEGEVVTLTIEVDGKEKWFRRRLKRRRPFGTLLPLRGSLILDVPAGRMQEIRLPILLNQG